MAARVLPSGDVVLTTDSPETARILRDRAGWSSVLGATARVKRPRFTVLVKHVAKDAIDCTDQEVARRTIHAQNGRLHGVVDFLHLGKSTRDANREPRKEDSIPYYRRGNPSATSYKMLYMRLRSSIVTTPADTGGKGARQSVQTVGDRTQHGSNHAKHARRLARKLSRLS